MYNNQLVSGVYPEIPWEKPCWKDFVRMMTATEYIKLLDNGNLSFSVVNGVPTGAIFALPDTQASGTGYQSNGIPTGYLECNGANISRSTFAALFAVIGTRYGTGDGATTFGLPDLRGEFIRGWDNNRNVVPLFLQCICECLDI